MSFDHREPGTPAASWTPFLDGVHATALDPAAFGSVVVLAPHPDDETLGAGGLIALAADAGTPVVVLLATRGERSHPDSPTTSPDRLAAIRETEVVAALHALHPGITMVWLDLPDGGLREHAEDLAASLTELLSETASPTLLVAPWRGDGHRDHRIAGEVAESVAARSAATTLVEYPIWMWHWDDPATTTAPWDHVRSVAVPPGIRERKSAAIRAYVSQTEPLSDAPGDEAVVDDGHRAHAERTRELFFEPSQAPEPPSTEPASTEPASTGPSRSQASFDAHYARKPGGWDFEGSWYEQRKRALTVAALPRARFRSALEIGCATGVLTRAITERADRTLGIDITEAPLEAARRNAPDGRFVRMTVPDEWPDGSFDLVVLSEIGYYLSSADLDGTIDRIAQSLDDDGVLLACHWRHPDTEAVSSGDAVHERLRSRWPRPPVVLHLEDDFVLEVFPGRAAESVARETGLVR
ncbi:PIG-L family deacetylase [Curtobacterium sp. RRHDQ10]|uniref:PIG-L family deacetylase n=1 Tax=Curtobacterium phyllosphaerae TaxID=3413379 RepID=UPI003BF0528B